MSHSLHRYGTVEDLKNDFCMYARCARGVNRDDPGDKLRKILDIYMSEDYVNFGSSHAGRSKLNGLDPEEYRKTLDHAYGIIISFSERESVKNVLAKLKDADLGISIVVSGLIDEVKGICQEVGLTPHTATLSLGIHGKKELLPDEETLKVITMCGHSLIGAPLVRSVAKKVEEGRLSPSQGAEIIGKPCTCGIFNTRRCAALMGDGSDGPCPGCASIETE
ncbi:MAG: hypothetical protein HFG62_06805 [Lachnospiraceae bacterium]|jgi:hypothetical protein|nr:hypothetical protein [Lachnospiraceae bacterium]